VYAASQAGRLPWHREEERVPPAAEDTLWRCLPLRLALLLVGLLLVGLSSPAVDDPIAHELIRKREVILRSQTNIGRYRMQVIRPTWQRSITFVGWDDVPGKRSFLRVLAPPKDKDTAFLKVRGNLWMYMPKLERDLKLPPSMMLGSWMGSDFTHDDLVKAASVIDDYTHRTLARETVGSAEIFTIESLPKPEAPVVWGKLVHRVTEDGMPLETTFYDEHGKLVRRLLYEAITNVHGHPMPTRWSMQPLTEVGHQSVLEIERLEFDVPIPEAVFERANLTRREP
jgi:hypothetical protein